MSGKHTPGPWRTYGDEVYGADGLRVAEAVRERDKALVLAAPDLLKALQAYDAWADKTPAADKELKALREQMRAAIAKAEGR
jgi:hypothetical protein